MNIIIEPINPNFLINNWIDKDTDSIKNIFDLFNNFNKNCIDMPSKLNKNNEL